MSSLTPLLALLPVRVPGPVLRDASGRLRVGPALSELTRDWVLLGATSILYAADGSAVGVYVDNETPGRDVVARNLVAMGVGLVVVGLYPSEVGHRIAGCLTALEWYPFWGRGWAWPPLPRAEAFILQWSFAWPGHRPPSRWQRGLLLLRARSRRPRPKLILLY